MQQNHPDASNRFKSLDDIWYYGGQDEHQQEAIYPHEALHQGEVGLGEHSLCTFIYLLQSSFR